MASAVRFFPYYSPFHACLSSTTEEHGSTKSCALSPLALCARPLHTPLEPHLSLVTVLEGKVCLPVLLTPRAIFLRIAHNGVDIPVAVEARVEVQHEVAAVLPYVHSKPGETERWCKGGTCQHWVAGAAVQAAPRSSGSIHHLLTHPLASDRIFPLTLMHSPGWMSS